jgi:cytochrome b6-f complex iron-sulfur subunit
LERSQDDPKFRTRRKIVWAAILGLVAGAAGLALLAYRFFVRFFLPRAAFEPTTTYAIGKPSDFTPGVTTKFLESYRVYVVKNTERLFVMYARCTHLGCTPDWKPAENRFSCPCHGSAFCMGSQFDQEGAACAGPAPRPLDRLHVELDRDGRIVVDSVRLYSWPKDGENQFNRAGAYIKV